MFETYTVDCWFEIGGNPSMPDFTYQTKSQKQAEKEAEYLANKKEYELIEVSFFRPSDSQSGFINPGTGADFSPVNWVTGK